MPRSLLLAFCLFSLPVLAGDFKAAFVDLQRAVSEVDDGRAARGRLQGLIDKKQKELEAARSALQKEQTEYLKTREKLADAERQKRDKDLAGRVNALADRADKERTEVALEERKSLDFIFTRMQGLLGEMAQREGLSMVLDRGAGVAWAEPSLDLTNDLIRAYNAKYAGKSAKDAPKK